MAWILANRTLAEVVSALLLILGFALYERHQGALRCERADSAAVASQEAHNAAIAQSQAQAIAKEAKTYADTLLQPYPAPVVRLCLPASAVPKAAPAAPGHHASPALPGSAQPDFVPGPNIGQPLYALTRQADAQVKALQAYIREVCQ